jgi:hypothetical protein
MVAAMCFAAALGLLLVGSACEQTTTIEPRTPPHGSGKYELSAVNSGQQFDLSGLRIAAPEGSGWYLAHSPNLTSNELCFGKLITKYHTLLTCAGIYPLTNPETESDQMPISEILYSQIAAHSSGRYRLISWNFIVDYRAMDHCVGYEIRSEDIEAIPRPPSGEHSILRIEGHVCPSPPGHVARFSISERALESQAAESWDEMRSFLSEVSLIIDRKHIQERNRLVRQGRAMPEGHIPEFSSRPSQQADYDVCFYALKSSSMVWETRSEFYQYVQEAKRRGLSEKSCRSMLAR